MSSKSKKFKYEISNLDDVVTHLDSLWELHNKLAEDPSRACQCSDPPCAVQDKDKDKDDKDDKEKDSYGQG